MPNIINLLPDHVANQIAAGEVVQRPASAVKELIENSVDAGATEIHLNVKDSGKTLIQVIDNGKGMSSTDLVKSFERHATSKISNADDLFSIRTKGFRGEALASIAAVAQVEVLTKQEEDDHGTCLKIEGSEIKDQEPAPAPTGTNFQVKNLFFNIPARRTFLKSNNVEFKHIIDEFEHVALAHPNIHFTLTHNGSEIMNLPEAGLRQRIAGVFGKKYNERLVPVEEHTDVVTVTGFVVKPEFAKKTRGDQFFFVNDRYIKNSYLHHAVNAAFEGLLPTGVHPGYFLFLTLDPQRIDVNIHPTKTEIKFEDEKVIYAMLRSAIKHSLGQFNISPTLDFDSEVKLSVPPLQKGQRVQPPTIEVDPNFNPFAEDEVKAPKSFQGYQPPKPPPSAGGSYEWTQLNTHAQEDFPQESLYEENSSTDSGQHLESASGDMSSQGSTDSGEVCVQLNKTYILSPLKSGMAIIHQQRAHERILYEEYLNKLEGGTAASQQLLFPLQLALNPSDAPLLLEHLDILRGMGFDIEPFGQSGVVIQGIPLTMKDSEVEGAIHQLLEDAKNHRDAFSSAPQELMAKNFARSGAIKTGVALEREEMLHLIHQLFACSMPFMGIQAKPTLIHIEGEELASRFA
ncbi:MAG: DNA mismatch repair endonuclease MutL [Schleiferiaceae bacterium]